MCLYSCLDIYIYVCLVAALPQNPDLYACDRVPVRGAFQTRTTHVGMCSSQLQGFA